MPMDWPNAAYAADHPVDTSRGSAGRSRLSNVCADFFLDDVDRLTDEERALMGAMLRSLVEDVADELLTRLPGLLAAQGEVARDRVYPDLRRAGLINRSSIVALLLRHADEQQLGRRTSREEDELLSALVGDGDGTIAEAAMALTIARGRRRDRFGRLGVEFDDLSAEDAVAVVLAIAACVGTVIGEGHDQLLADSARKIIARHDEGRRLEAAVAALVRSLDGTGRLTDDMIDRFAQAGDSSLLVAALARRCGIGVDDGWDLFTRGDAMLLARMAGCRRSTAATIIASFDPLFGLGSPEKAIDRFDRIDEATADETRNWMKLDPDYRAARIALERSNG